MISVGSLSLGIGLPWFLLGAIPAIVALVYIFRRRGLQSPKIISSLFLLKHLPRAEVNRKTLRLPLQFWLEVFLVLVLLGLLSQIYIQDSRKRVAIIIDASKSMSALQDDGFTRLQIAKQHAKNDIQENRYEARYVVYAAERSMYRIAGGDRTKDLDATQAVSLIDSVAQTHRNDDLQSRINELAQRSEFDELWIYTDKQSDFQDPDARIRVKTIPRSDAGEANLWIARIQVVEDTNEDATFLELDTRQIGLTGGRGNAELNCFELLANAPVTHKMVALKSLEAGITTTRIPLVTDEWDYCHVEVTMLPTSRRDVLVGDNHAWVTRSNSQPLFVVVSPLSLKDLKLESMKPYQFISKEKNSTQKQYRHVLHRSSTIEDEHSSLLMVMPPKDSKYNSDSIVVSQVKQPMNPTRWQEGHPILQYVRPDMLQLLNALILRCPVGAQELMFIEQGPVLCAGQTESRRYVITGFDLFPFAGKENSTLSILTLNIFRYLSGDGGRVANEQSVDRDMIAIQTADTVAKRTASPVPVQLAGVYRSPDVHAGEEQVRALNFISESESEINKQGVLFLSNLKNIEKRSTTQSESSESFAGQLRYLLIIAALCACVADIIVRLVGRKPWEGR